MNFSVYVLVTLDHESHYRAELIRIQIQLDRAQYQDENWPEWIHRETELLKNYQNQWERPFRNQIRPSLRSPAEWLKSHLFGTGGSWGFRRGFIEQILTTAATYLQADCQLFGCTPIQQVLLNHSSLALSYLREDNNLNQLQSLHLISDVEFDDDMAFLIQSAHQLGLPMLEFRIPRLDTRFGELLALLQPMDDSSDSGKALEIEAQLNEFSMWAEGTDEERNRLEQIATRPRILHLLDEGSPTSEVELLYLNEWICFGNQLKEAGLWAMAKSYHDLENQDGNCRRIAIFSPEKLNPKSFKSLFQSSYFHHEVLPPTSSPSSSPPLK